MLDCVTVTLGDTTYLVPNVSLLHLLEKGAQHASSTFDVPGTGAKTTPWKLSGAPASWLKTAQLLRQHVGRDCFIAVCGRLVRKGANSYYMSDQGGLADAAGPGGNPGKAWEVVGDDATDRGGPSYNQFAQRFDERSRSEVGAAKKKWEEADAKYRQEHPKPSVPVGATPSQREKQAIKRFETDYQANFLSRNPPPSSITWNQEKAGVLRQVLKHEAAMVQSAARSGPTTLNATFPVLAAALLLAEPARNRRAFPEALMLLTFLQRDVTYGGRKSGSAPKHYTFDNVLWSNYKIQYDSRQGRRVSTKEGVSIGELHTVGGKLPAAMTGSGAPQVATDLDMELELYTHDKEITLLARWLAVKDARFTPGNAAQATGATVVRADATTVCALVGDDWHTGADPAAAICNRIYSLVKARCETFDVD